METGKKDYITLRPVALGSNYYSDGVRISLSDKQAEFLLGSGTIRLADESAAVVLENDSAASVGSTSGKGVKGSKA